MSDFSDWLTEELNERGWNKSELVRRSGLSTGYTYRIVNGKVNPGADACRGIALALDIPVETITNQIEYPVKQSTSDNRVKFSEWIQHQLNDRGWVKKELGMRSGLDISYVNQIILGHRNPGPKACRGIAKALEIPEVIVFQQFGYLTQDPAIDPTTETFITILSQLPEDDQSELLEIAKIKLYRQNHL
ncbi:helix-turn-helix domain-containing protein [Chloroflexota bacterium]